MTGYTVHTGSSVKFSQSWDRIFSGGSRGKAKQTPTATAKKPPAKKAAAKKAKRKRRA